MTDDTPTVEEALARLAGRRATAIELAAHAVVATPGVSQNRHVRRNNLRLARLESRKGVVAGVPGVDKGEP